MLLEKNASNDEIELVRLYIKHDFTCNQKQIAITEMKTMKTCHATCDMTAIIYRSCIIAKVNFPIMEAMFKFTALWSVDAYERTNKL